MSDPSDETRWSRLSNAADADLSEYRALSGLAVVGFGLGLLSFVILLHLGLLFVAAAAVLFCTAALIRISAAPSETAGRGLAVAGLVLAVFWTASGVARVLTHQRLMDVRSREFAIRWFEFLKNDEPEKACELTGHLSARRPLDDLLWERYLSDEVEYERLEDFVGSPEIRALLALGNRAQVRHYAHDGTSNDTARQIFAVTYDDKGTKKSFLISVTVKRIELFERDLFGWTIEATGGPWDPDAA
jgi:hypothetical protein